MNADVDAAVEVLGRGGLVAFPTETVYGLGADATNPTAVRRLFAVKGRPTGHPVIVHLGDVDQVDEWAIDVPEPARRLTRAFWPGPLTVIVHRSSLVVDEVTGGRHTVGLRVPDQPLALALLRAFGGGIAAPSANRFGRVSPTTAQDVVADLGDDVDLVLDGGPCALGIESTIVDCTGPEPGVARLGGVTLDALTEVLGVTPPVRNRGEIAAPGSMVSHYAPEAEVHVVSQDEVAAMAVQRLSGGSEVGVLALSPPAGLPAEIVVLDPPADIDDYARVLYARLREADARGIAHLYVVPPPNVGLGAAIADRLQRAQT